MLTFRRKYKKIKQIEVNEGPWNAWDIFHRTRSQSFACAKMASAPKKPRQTLLRTFFHSVEWAKEKHCMYFLNQHNAFEDLSFHSFLKVSDWDFEEKKDCNEQSVVNIVLTLIVLKAQILSGKRWKYHFQAFKFQNFLGGLPSDPPRKFALLALEKLPAAYFLSGDVYFKTYWQHCNIAATT